MACASSLSFLTSSRAISPTPTTSSLSPLLPLTQKPHLARLVVVSAASADNNGSFFSRLRSQSALTRSPEKRHNLSLPLDSISDDDDHHLPYLDLVATSHYSMMGPVPGKMEQSAPLNRLRSGTPPDLPSVLLHGRVILIGMPFVPAVTELVVAQVLYLQWDNPNLPIYLYINSTGTTRDDGETVGLETEGFAIYDTIMQTKAEIHTVAIGAAYGHACLLLAAGKKGKRFMMPHSKAMIQQPRLPSFGDMRGSDLNIRTKELLASKDAFIKLFARHTGNSVETVAKKIQLPYYMNFTEAKEFGVVDKLLVRGGPKLIGGVIPPGKQRRRSGVNDRKQRFKPTPSPL